MKYPAVTFSDIWYLGSRLGYKKQVRSSIAVENKVTAKFYADTLGAVQSSF
jgi:hypothetical protein